MHWGAMTGGWLRQAMQPAEDYFAADLQVLASYGLDVAQWPAARLMDLAPSRRRQLAEALRQRDMCAVLGIRGDWLSDDRAAVGEAVRAAQQAIKQLAGPMRAPICTTAAGRYHRFMRETSLAEQMDRLADALAPVARAAQEAGAPLAVENHGDYYCSDLAALCRRVPHLGIFLDTGNTFLIGERPLPAVRDAAPYTLGTHFKDHYAAPRFSPLGFEIRGAVPGAGDVELREAYRILIEDAPDPDRLAMILEIDPVEGMEPEETLRKAVQFVRSL